MAPGLVRDVLTFALGVVTGVLSAAFGVGGAVVSTPGIRVLGAPALIAVGTTLPSVFPSAITGTTRYSREKLIRWDVVAWVGPTGAVTAVFGSLLSHAVPGNGHWLMITTAVFLVFNAWRMGRSRPDAPTDEASATVAIEPRQAFAIGAFSGGLSGLLGIGGGVVMVPAFSEILGLSTKVTIATSLACVGLFAVPGTITHAVLGDIDWRFAVILAVAVIPGARIGSALAIRARDHRLRMTVAAFLGAIAMVYGISELVAVLT